MKAASVNVVCKLINISSTTRLLTIGMTKEKKIMQNDYDEVVEIDISLSRVHTQRSETANSEDRKC